MLKKSIAYTDFNGDQVTETFYFNISEAELIEMDVDVEGGFQSYLQRIVEAQNRKEIVAAVKKLILTCVGQKSPDGRRFVKSEQFSKEFEQTPAYNALFMELATNEDAALIFIRGVMPKSLTEAVPEKLTDKSATITDINPS